MSQYAVVDPATGDTIQTYPTITDVQLETAVASAAAALPVWAHETTRAERAAVVKKVAELFQERREQLAEIILREMGKPLVQALGEVDFCVDIFGYYADNAEELLRDEPITLLAGDGRAFVRRGALGVLLGIMPWNYPYYQVARFAAPNLVIGNTLLLKPAPQCPESAAAIEQILRDAGAPEGTYTTVHATDDQVADVIADSRVQGVSLTGSERAGSAVGEVAGRNLKKVVLELGGSDPFIVLSTDDIDATVQAAVGARLENSGQACNAAKRFIVADDLYDAFLGRFVSAFEAVAPGDTGNDTVGPLSSQAAAERLDDQVARAVEHGGVLVTGGTREGTYFSTTVITDVTADNPAYREEFFGPVAMVFRVAGEAEAVALANDTPFGLGSYVYTTDADQALRVADQLEAGMVYVNIVGADGAELPFGGVKRSGSGRELGRFGADEFVNKKLIRIA